MGECLAEWIWTPGGLGRAVKQSICRRYVSRVSDFFLFFLSGSYDSLVVVSWIG